MTRRFKETDERRRTRGQREKRARAAPMQCWLSRPLPADVAESLDRMRRAQGVARVAVMPDVHLAKGACIGTVMATRGTIYPDAVGGDIGCGIAAIAFDCGADVLHNETAARTVLSALPVTAPVSRRRTPIDSAWLRRAALAAGELDAMRRRIARYQLGTLGRGNHFLEFQRDDDDRLWLMVHSGSRGIGQAIREHYLARADGTSRGMGYLRDDSEAGRAYLHDMGWARGYAENNRRTMIAAVGELMRLSFGAELSWPTYLRCDHNHVRRETHGGEKLWVHRKGAIDAAAGRIGIIPGSMASESYHVIGRGRAEALRSSSHGAGRAMDRTTARRQVSVGRVRRELQGVWFDARMAGRLRDEAPSAYKDISAVMRAQRQLTRIVRRLRPVLCYKGG